MKIVCSAASCKYSSEDEDSSNVVFINFPNNDTASIWAHNCGRPDLLVKPVQDLHSNQYICADHIEEQFFLRKTNPILIARGAIPTLFGNAAPSANILDSIKESEREIDTLQSTECTNSVDKACSAQNLDKEARQDFQEETYNREAETDNSSSLHFCEIAENLEQFPSSSGRVTNLCRICGQQTTKAIEIFAKKGLQLRLQEKIGMHTPICVNLDDALPQKLCSDCCDKLEAMHSLVVTCLQTDMKLRKILNISGKPIYDPKFKKLVSVCAREIANEISLDNVSSVAKKTKKLGTRKKFHSKWKETPRNTELEQVRICPIAETSNENNSNFKYVVRPDLNHLLQALESIEPKIDERNEELSATSTETAQTKEIRKLVCNNEEETGQKDANTKQVESNIVCPVCSSVFDNAEYFKNHKSSCNETTQFNCQKCDKLFANKDDLVVHELSHTKKCHPIVTNGRCGHCLATFKTRKELQTHMTDNHDGQPLYKCSICDKTYEKWSSLDVHEATHRADKPYLCDLCGKSFKHSNNLRGHKRIHLDDAKKKRHVCDLCSSAFRSRFHLREHMNQHNGNKPYTCDECGKAFFKRIQLRQHRLSHGTHKHTCPICAMTFSRRGNMNSHLKRHEKSAGMYTCSVCEHKCKSMSELKMHRKQHSEREIMESIKLKAADKTVWQCKICDKIFPKRAILVNHEHTHTGDRMKIECDKCGKKLANKNSLKYHNKSKHSNERPHMCQYCGEAFVSKEARLIHERIHTGERPYSCKICNMQYRCSSNLSQHMKIHSATRPHVCQYCKKSFSRKGALTVHERIHTGVKPFACEICSRSFSQKNDMLKHMKTHQPKQSMQCEKCDKVFKSKSEILKHLSVHERNEVEDSVIPAYDEIVEPLETFTLTIECPTIPECEELQNV